MRTKHLLTALALPALFAACTNDDFVEQAVNNGNASLDDRQMVDVPALNLNMGDDLDTRLGIGSNGKFYFDNDDLLGACLMDEISESYTTSTKWSDRFMLVDYIQTNYKFAYNSQTGNFENNALMCEGNYFFYYPYNPEMNTREAFKKELNAEQTLEANPDGSLTPRKTVLENQIFLGHSAIYGDREDHDALNVNMKGVFAYPAFRIAYSSPQPITIKKVAFKIVDNSGDAATEGAVTPFKTMLQVAPKEVGLNPDVQYTLNAGDYYKVTDDRTAEQISVSMPDNAACTLSSGSTLAGYVVLPAGVYDANNNQADYKSLWMYVYTDRGIVKTYLNIQNHEQDTGSSSTSDNVWTKAAYTDFQPGNGMLIDMGFSYEAIAAPDEFTVTNTEDFETILGWQKNQSVKKNLTATVVGDKVVLSKAIFDILNNNSNLSLTLKSGSAATVTIAADAPANALDKISIAQNNGARTINVINKATLNVANNFGNAKSLTNEGNITFTGASYDLDETPVVNKGTMTFNRAAGTTLTLGNDDTTGLYNVGTLVIATDVNVSGVSGGIWNKGTMTINQGETLTAKIINGEKRSKLGTLNVNGTWKVQFTASENYGIINVAEGGVIAMATGAN